MMKKLLVILLISNVSIGFSQETPNLSDKDSILLERLIFISKKYDSLNRQLDSISKHSDSIFIQINKPIIDSNFCYDSLIRKHERFKKRFIKYIDSNNFPNGLPIDNIETSSIIGYGEKYHPIFRDKKFHKGLDFPAKKGERIKSTISGIVENVKDKKNGHGKQIIIRSDLGIRVFYGHLDSIMVKETERVKKGQIIGTVGNTGMSTANHLHYEVMIDNRNINPIFTILDYLNKNDLIEIYTNNNISLD